MKRLNVIIIAALILLALAGAVSAWGTSVNIAAVDDQGINSCGSDVVCSDEMGGVPAADIAAAGMTGTMTRVEPTNINAATLASYDTLFLFNCNPGVFSSTQQADIVAFIKGGHKLVIWDSEDQYYDCGGAACWDYSWMPASWKEYVPGANGATGTLTIVEENQLSSNDPTDPLWGAYFIDAPFLSISTDAVGDSNIMTGYVASEWCTDMEATNYLNKQGPVHAYTRGPTANIGDGIIIFSGLDWDDYNYGTGPAGWLERMLAYEFNADSLPCSHVTPQYFKVTKTADQTKYNIGDPIVFDMSVLNDGQYIAEAVEAVDHPPAGVSCDLTPIALGDIVPDTTVPFKLTCKAVAEGCGLTNSVVVTGDFEGELDIFSGSATSAPFDIGYCGPVNAPEFPTLALPIGMIIGIVFIVYSVKRKE